MTPLVFVHGFLGGSDQWHLQEPLGRDRPLIQLDLPGYGRNAHFDPIDRIEEFARWVLSELSNQGIEHFDLLGHSMGGMVAQDVVKLAPDRVDRLILYGTGPVGELPGRFETIATSIERAKEDGAQTTARRFAATWYRDKEEAEGYPACAEIAAQATLPAIVAGLQAMQNWSGNESLKNIQSPSLVLWGDLDRSYAWSQVERLWKAIPNCNLAVVPNSAHAVHSENPSVFNELVRLFLDAG